MLDDSPRRTDGIELDGRPGHAARRGAADRHRRARARDHPQPPRLPRRLRRRARAPRRHRLAARPARRGARTPARGGRRSRGAEVDRSPCPELCPRFTARVFEDVTIGPSPLWLKARLMAAGQRPINNVVDITNYVMLLTGQPLHAFDLDRVAGARLTVRRAGEGEQVTTLDGQTRTLDGRDGRDRRRRGADLDRGHDGRRALGGSDRTPRACCSRPPPGTAPTSSAASWALGPAQRGLRSLREGPRAGAVHATRRRSPRGCWSSSAARASHPGTIDVGRRRPAAPARSGCARRACGRSSACRDRAASARREILAALGLRRRAARARASTSPCPPLRRDDVTREVDLIEEVARIDGLERLPATLPARRGAAGRLTHAQRVRRRAEDALAGRGLYEIVGWSFADPAPARPAATPPARPACGASCTVENPLSEAQSILRPTLLGSLLDAARHNVARNRDRGRALRVGHRLPRPRRQCAARRRARRRAPRARRAPERAHRAPLVARRARRRPTSSPPRRCSRRCSTRSACDWSVAPSEDWPFLHPGRTASVLAGGAADSASSASCTRSSPRRWDLRAHRRLRARPRQARRRRAGGRLLPRPSARSRRCARTSR